MNPNTGTPSGLEGYPPHPLLKEPVLYIADPPSAKYFRLPNALFRCGLVTEDAITPAEGNPRRRMCRVRFKNLMFAELALATVNGTRKTWPPWTIRLSHSPTLEKATPSRRLLPQYAQCDSDIFFKNGLPMEIVFKWFRTAGPIVSIRKEANLGQSPHTLVVEYWHEDHANFARMMNNALHKNLKKRPAFTLRTYDPWSIRCTGIGPAFTHSDLLDSFSKFGKVTSSAIIDAGKPGAYGIVTFSNQVRAAEAIREMNNRVIGATKVSVRIEEPDAQDVFHRSFPKRTMPSEPSPETSTAHADDPSPDHATDDSQAKAGQQSKEESEDGIEDYAIWKAADAKVKRFEDRRRQREAAEQDCAQARHDFEAATMERRNACRDYVSARQFCEEVEQELVFAQHASTEAKRIWLEAMEREAKVRERASTARETVSVALGKRSRADSRRRIAKEEEMSTLATMEGLDREIAGDVPDEETLRQAKLAESFRRMQELRKIEAAEKEERVRRELQAEEERLRQQREAAEKTAREQREREERDRRDAELRRQRYDSAVAAERARCELRDRQFYPLFAPWGAKNAFARFKFVSEEFDVIRFQETQPLTLESVPWPVLGSPWSMTSTTITWEAVETFFAAVRNMLEDEAEYKSVVEKAQRRFHPDRWRSRGILSSVLDNGLRGRLETCGTVVAQAITPLWLELRQRDV